jgi:flagellar protein FlaI
VKYATAFFKTSTGKKKLRIVVRDKQQPQEEEPVVKTGYIGAIQPSILLGGMPGVPEQKEQNEHMKDITDLLERAVELPAMTEEKFVVLPADEEDLKTVNFRYPLIPKEPKQGERVFAYAHIYFDRLLNEVVYNVVEPQLDMAAREILENVKEFIQEKLDINFAQVRKQEATDYINELFNRAVKYFKIKYDLEVLRYYVLRDFMGLGAVEPLMQDKNIEDISCDGVEIPIYVYHRAPKLGSIRTSIMFTRRDELDSFVNKLSERCGKTISVARPLLDGTLPDGSRVQATLGSDIARRGSNFTIRMFTEKPLTPIDLLEFGTCDLKMLSYLWYLVEHDASILISGGTASGKTTLLNVLSLFIKPQMKIVSIEDTAELRLAHAHWVPEVARTPLTEEGKVDMYELLKESLRQRPDYIIVGEVRGKEAYVLFQQMAVGHAGMATIHAENFPKLLDRLATQPIGLPLNLIQNLDLIIFARRVKQGRRYSRKAWMVTEVLGYDPRKEFPIINDVFKWVPVGDRFTVMNKSAILRKIADMTGSSEADITRELQNRAKVLRWMAKQKIKDYRKVSGIINLYYLSPDFLMRKIEGGL